MPETDPQALTKRISVADTEVLVITASLTVSQVSGCKFMSGETPPMVYLGHENCQRKRQTTDESGNGTFSADQDEPCCFGTQNEDGKS